MAITTERIIGHEVDIIATSVEDAPLTKWKDFDMSFMEKTTEANTSDSVLDEEVGVKKWVEGRVTGLMGAANNGATLPMPGDTIDIGAVTKADGTSVVPNVSEYGPIKVKAPVKYSIGDGPASFEFAYRSGRLNGAL